MQVFYVGNFEFIIIIIIYSIKNQEKDLPLSRHWRDDSQGFKVNLGEVLNQLRTCVTRPYKSPW